MVTFAILAHAYNQEKIIHEHINSVTGQTYPHFRVYYLDASDTNATKQVIEEYAKNDPRILYYYNDNMLGSGIAYNKVLVDITEDYVLFLDGDDAFVSPDFLEKLAGSIEQYDSEHTADIYYLDYINHYVKTGKTEPVRQNYLPTNTPITVDETTRKNLFLTMTNMYWNKAHKTSFLKTNKILMYHNPKASGVDLGFFLITTLLVQKAAYFPITSVMYNLNPTTSVSYTFSNKKWVMRNYEWAYRNAPHPTQSPDVTLGILRHLEENLRWILWLDFKYIFSQISKDNIKDAHQFTELLKNNPRFPYSQITKKTHPFCYRLINKNRYYFSIVCYLISLRISRPLKKMAKKLKIK